jgi:hypothetical protein
MPNATSAENDPFFAIICGGEWNACIGKQGSEENYIDGYMEAAVELASSVIEKCQYGKRDTLALPILYNARHAVELALKFVIDRLVEVRVLRQIHPKNHDIKSHWELIQSAQLGDLSLREFIERLKKYVDSLHGIDEDGQQLRYAETQDGRMSLEDLAICNLELIRDSLRDLQKLLIDLRYRAIDVVHERRSGTFTKELSRSDLFALTDMLPPRDAWEGESFAVAKVAVRKRFGLSTKALSTALNLIQTHRQMGSQLGLEFPLEHLRDEDVHFLVGEWGKANPERTEPQAPVALVRVDRDTLIVRRTASAAMKKAVGANLSPEKIAGMHAIYYIGNLRPFSEEYFGRLDDAMQRLRAGGSPSDIVNHIMAKSDFPRALARGVEILGRPKLAAALRALRKNYAD